MLDETRLAPGPLRESTKGVYPCHGERAAEWRTASGRGEIREYVGVQMHCYCADRPSVWESSIGYAGIGPAKADTVHLDSQDLSGRRSNKGEFQALNSTERERASRRPAPSRVLKIDKKGIPENACRGLCFFARGGHIDGRRHRRV